MHALEDGNTEDAMRVGHDLIRFCGPKGPLIDDAYSLAAVVRSHPNKASIPLLYKYFEKIFAISDERFKDAARLRDQIKTMRA